MRSLSLLAALLVAPAAILAQNSTGNGTTSGNSTYLTGLLTALQMANLTSLASVAQELGSTPAGAAILGALPNGNKTIFAPNNDVRLPLLLLRHTC